MNLHIFYLGYNDSDHQAEIKQLMTLKNVQKNILIFDEGQISNIDLQGIEIKTITGSWAPYFIEGNSKHEGFFVDFLDEAAKIMNFTWKAVLSTDWGSYPKSGYIPTYIYFSNFF